ncbi:hypothetical protein NPIL_228571 [Nephila pilipes]|uniref:Uncharacterized protein n=1 Tax=Nephila pilipes TaxID=299642 RepID=A0A8X6PKV5_NEPPI|nr:hypothetical protein NPIL_228571 [Nephila pilipes]
MKTHKLLIRCVPVTPLFSSAPLRVLLRDGVKKTGKSSLRRVVVVMFGVGSMDTYLTMKEEITPVGTEKVIERCLSSYSNGLTRSNKVTRSKATHLMHLLNL